MVSKPKSSAPPADPKRAQQWLGPKARWCIGHDYSCSRGLKGPTCCPEHLASPLPLSAIEEYASLGCSCFFWGPHLLHPRDFLWCLCGSAFDDLPGRAHPSGALAKWEGTTFSLVCSSLAPVLPCWYCPLAMWARGHPAAWTAGDTHPAMARVTLW